MRIEFFLITAIVFLIIEAALACSTESIVGIRIGQIICVILIFMTGIQRNFFLFGGLLIVWIVLGKILKKKMDHDKI